MTTVCEDDVRDCEGAADLYNFSWWFRCHFIVLLLLSVYWSPPIQRGRVQNVPFEEKICAKYHSENSGDELPYIFLV